MPDNYVLNGDAVSSNTRFAAEHARRSDDMCSYCINCFVDHRYLARLTFGVALYAYCTRKGYVESHYMLTVLL